RVIDHDGSKTPVPCRVRTGCCDCRTRTTALSESGTCGRISAWFRIAPERRAYPDSRVQIPLGMKDQLRSHHARRDRQSAGKGTSSSARTQDSPPIASLCSYAQYAIRVEAFESHGTRDTMAAVICFPNSSFFFRHAAK